MNYLDPVGEVKGIGEKTEKVLERLDIRTVGDLLEHYPSNYELFDKICMIRDVEEGKKATLEVSLSGSPTVKKIRNLSILSCFVKDTTGRIKLTWFNMPFLKSKLRAGNRYIFRGKIVNKGGMLVMEQPKLFTREEYIKKMGILQPVYPLTEGMTNHMLSKYMDIALKNVEWDTDFLSGAIRQRYDLAGYKWAVKQIHFPKDNDSMRKARKRIIFDEFFFFTLALRELKKKKQLEKNKFSMQKEDKCEKMLKELPFELTKAQKRVWNEIKEDMQGEYRMNRLIQGDVGSGKTILAALAMLLAGENGYQSAMMVPTEVLARQHYESMESLFKERGIRVGLLTGSMKVKEKKEIYRQIQCHEIDVVIGTHALIQEKVEFDNLAFVITDEQHRFGVRQREMLSVKGDSPHILVMSATPIPRTLAIILYGDLDLSIIDELPSNRLPIKNCVVDTGYRNTAYRFLEKQVLEGRQAYVICPMVEESEMLEAENVIEYTEKLKETLPDFVSIAYLHGKMKPKEKNEIMESFFNGKIQILVSTTVVEVGVNVPNATVMMIENAERFGLAQLHQLRGRVGRGKWQSYCILVSGSADKETKRRLEILNKSNDGFYIAGEDLRLRGPGDFFGIRQSGILEFKMGDIFQDADILKDANEAAANLKPEEILSMCKKNDRIRRKIENFSGEVLL